MEERNHRPKEGSRLPDITLAVLFCLILALLYAGWEYMKDNSTSNELSNQKVDSTAILDEVADSSAKDLPPVQIITPTSVAPKNTSATVSTTTSVAKPKPVEEKPVESKPEETTKPAPNLGGQEITHTVEVGQTFYGIANRYNMKFSTLQALNPQIKDVSTDVKSGVTKLNVRVQAIHTVGPGDVLRVVAQKYGITVDLLMKANGKTKNYAERGEKLIIPFGEKK
jgi:LysM repeat protein